MSFTDSVRDELAHLAIDDPSATRQELTGALRFGGLLRLTGGGRGWAHVLTTDSGAVARRVRAGLAALPGAVTQVEIHRPRGPRRGSQYRVVQPAPADAALRSLGLIDPAGRPVDGLAYALPATSTAAAAYARGVLLVAASFSEPARRVHVEIRAPGRRAAEELVELLARLEVGASSSAGPGGGDRVVLKAGPGVGALLVRVGAHHAFIEWDAQRLRRELRGEANRAANADRANVRRSVEAATRQVAAIAEALQTLDWSAVPAEVRAAGLARLANPEASLSEIGALLDPPVGKAVVHRRLTRLLALTQAAPGPAAAPPAGGGAQGPG